METGNQAVDDKKLEAAFVRGVDQVVADKDTFVKQMTENSEAHNTGQVPPCYASEIRVCGKQFSLRWSGDALIA